MHIPIWVDSWLIPLKDESGRPNAVLGVSRDFTERKKTEDALRESEEKWRTLVQNIPDIIISVARDGEQSAVV